MIDITCLLHFGVFFCTCYVKTTGFIESFLSAVSYKMYLMASLVCLCAV